MCAWPFSGQQALKVMHFVPMPPLFQYYCKLFQHYPECWKILNRGEKWGNKGQCQACFCQLGKHRKH